jgi:hypothetical protein
MDWILDLLTQLGTAINYNAIADLHTLQFTTAPAKSFPAFCFFKSRSLATATNGGDPSASRAQVLLSQPPMQNSLKSQIPAANHQLQNATESAYNILARNHIENTVSIVTVQQYFYRCNGIRCRGNPFTEQLVA